MIRRHDWPQALAAYIESRRTTPFAWGSHDCCRFAAGAVEAMTGADPMADFAYRNEVESLHLIRDAGTLEALVTRTLGEPMAASVLARRGDVVMADFDNGPTVGVCLGRLSAFAADTGVLFVPTSAARQAWRIG